MLETLLYLTSAVVTIAILARIAPPNTSVAVLIVLTTSLTAILAAARHGPTAVVDIIDAIARVLGR